MKLKTLIDKIGIENVKLIFRLYYKEKLNTFEIKDELDKLLEEPISKNQIARLLTSDLSESYKTVNVDMSVKKINKTLINTRNKERESNKDIQGAFLND